jgi:hypothetical protein
MSIDTCRKVYADMLEPDDEIDLADDEYGDNEQAVYSFATVIDTEIWVDSDGDYVVTVVTDQISFTCPREHKVKQKVNE